MAKKRRIIQLSASSAAGRWRAIVLFLVAFTLGALITSAFHEAQPTSARQCADRYALLNRLLPCMSTPESEWSYDSLRQELSSSLDTMQQQRGLAHVSVVFRDLDHGPRFQVGEFDDFYPASLLKVPIMMAVLHAAERNPQLLSQELEGGAFGDIDNVDEPDQAIQPGQSYTVAELLRRMIEYSDNHSMDLLTAGIARLAHDPTKDAYTDLGALPVMEGWTDSISIQSYANLFAVLYNSGYLTTDMSQYALDLLTKTTFVDGLVAGLPPGTKVAHKFGIRPRDPDLIELHDCGIVYHPATRYVLCVMTSGASEDNNEQTIADVSRMVYEGVSAVHL